MKAASQLPSAVLISTVVSVTGKAAWAGTDPAAIVNPPANETAPNCRRDNSRFSISDMKRSPRSMCLKRLSIGFDYSRVWRGRHGAAAAGPAGLLQIFIGFIL